MHQLGSAIIAILLLAACSSSSGNGDASRPSSAPPTSPAPTTTSKVAPPGTSGTAVAPKLAAVDLELTPVASGLSSPVDVAWRAHDRRMYVAEQRGRVTVVGSNGKASPTPVLALAVSSGNEQGLLGLTFSPDGKKLYVDYTDPNGDTHVDEFTMRGDVADRSTRREILFQQQPFANHNGGQVLTGPDGMLYITFGDGGSGGDPNGNGQNLGTWLGKILRVNPRRSAGAAFTVPADNPFVDKSGARPEVWMYGLRNPWRFSFDRANGDVWIGDVGQNKYEEIDFARAGDTGVNWGWNAREGFHAYKGDRPANARDPILETTHTDDNCAIVGGYVYRGRAIPLLRGAYLYGDNCNPTLTGVTERDGKVVDQRDLGQVQQLTSFGQDPQGELYEVSRDGTVYKLT